MQNTLDQTTRKSLAMKTLAKSPKLFADVQKGLDSPAGSPEQRRAASILRTIGKSVGLNVMQAQVLDGQGGISDFQPKNPIQPGKVQPPTPAQPTVTNPNAQSISTYQPKTVTPITTVDSVVKPSPLLSVQEAKEKFFPSIYKPTTPTPSSGTQTGDSTGVTENQGSTGADSSTSEPTPDTRILEADTWANEQIRIRGAAAAEQVGAEALELFGVPPTWMGSDAGVIPSSSNVLTAGMNYAQEAWLSMYDSLPDGSAAKVQNKWFADSLKSGMSRAATIQSITRNAQALADTFGYSVEDAKNIIHPDVAAESTRAYEEANKFYGVTSSFSDYLNAQAMQQGFKEEAWNYMQSHDQALGNINKAIEATERTYIDPAISGSLMSDFVSDHLKNLYSLRDATYSNYKAVVDKASTAADNRLKLMTSAYEFSSGKADKLATQMIEQYKENRTMNKELLASLEADVGDTYDRLVYGYSQYDAAMSGLRLDLETKEVNLMATQMKALDDGSTSTKDPITVNKLMDEMGKEGNFSEKQGDQTVSEKYYTLMEPDPESFYSQAVVIHKADPAVAIDAYRRMVKETIKRDPARLEEFVEAFASAYPEDMTLTEDMQARKEAMYLALSDAARSVAATLLPNVDDAAAKTLMQQFANGVSVEKIKKKYGNGIMFSNEAIDYVSQLFEADPNILSSKDGWKNTKASDLIDYISASLLKSYPTTSE